MPKSCDILILHCPPASIEYPPHAEALCAEMFSRGGFRVQALDLNLELWHRCRGRNKSFWLYQKEHYWHDSARLETFWQDNRDTIDRMVTGITRSGARILVVALDFPRERFASRFIKRVKEANPSLTVVAWGYSCRSRQQQEELQSLSGQGIDHFISGVDPYSLPECVFDLSRRGILSLESDQVEQLEHSSPAALRQDSTLFPHYREFTLERYRGRCLYVSFGHGCTASCSFCSRSIYPEQCFVRSGEQIINEIRYHLSRTGVRRFYFGGAPLQQQGQLPGILSETFRDFREKVTWSAEAAPVPSFSTETLGKLKEAGCHALLFCCVSGCDAVLTSMNAGFTPAELANTLKGTAAAGIRVAARFIYGFPGESHRELQATRNFLDSCSPPVISAVQSIQMVKAFSGTDFAREKESYGMTLPGPLAVHRWKSADGNRFVIRKGMQNQLVYHIMGLRILHNPHDLKIQVPPVGSLPWRERFGEMRYRLYHEHDPLHAYHSDIIAKQVITRVNRITSVVEKSDTDFPVIEGVLDGRQAFTGPETVHLDLTNHCNYNCIACWDRSPLVRGEGKGPAYLKNVLPLETITRFIDDLVDLGGTRSIKLGGGGEPTMHPQFREILSYLRSRDRYVEIDINTNFSRFNDDLIDQVVDLQVNLLTVSLWAATPEVYVATHPNQNEKVFARIVTNLQKVTGRQDSVLRLFIHNVLMKQNYHQVEEMLRLALDVAADEVHFTLVDPVPGKTESLLLSPEENQRLCESLQKIKPFVDRYNIYRDPETGRSIRITNFHELVVKMGQSEVVEGVYDKQALNKLPCYIGWLFARVMADGQVVPCCKGHRLPLGNLNQDSFQSVWNSPRYQTFRHNAKNMEKTAPYFSVMGNDKEGLSGCLNCDNIMHNTVMHDKYLCCTSLPRWFLFKMGQWRNKRVSAK